MSSQKTEKQKYVHEQVGDCILQLNNRMNENQNWFEFQKDFPVFVKELVEETWDKATEVERHSPKMSPAPPEIPDFLNDNPLAKTMINPVLDQMEKMLGSEVKSPNHRQNDTNVLIYDCPLNQQWTHLGEFLVKLWGMKACHYGLWHDVENDSRTIVFVKGGFHESVGQYPEITFHGVPWSDAHKIYLTHNQPPF